MQTSSLGIYFRDVREVCVPIDREEAARLIRRYQRKNNVADRNRVVVSALRWVLKLAHSYARRYRAYHLFPDIIQEGNLGLMLAAERFEPNLGYAFSTYATWWIRARIGRCIVEQAESVRPSHYMHEKFVQLSRFLGRLEQRLQRKPSEEEVVADGFDADLLEKLRRNWFGGVVSLDEPMESDDGRGRTLHEVIPDNAQMESFVREVNSMGAKEAIADHLRNSRHHSPRNVQMFIAYFGLDGGSSRTLEEAGEQLGVSKQRAKQAIDKILLDPGFRWYVARQLNFMTGRRRHKSSPTMARIKNPGIAKIITAAEKACFLNAGDLLKIAIPSAATNDRRSSVLRARRAAIRVIHEGVGMSPREIGTLFGMSTKTVKTLLCRSIGDRRVSNTVRKIQSLLRATS
jgi:RNA polymerase sigma factor (sigma-70 family)